MNLQLDTMKIFNTIAAFLLFLSILQPVDLIAQNIQQARQEAFELAMRARAIKDPGLAAQYEEQINKNKTIKETAVDLDNGMLDNLPVEEEEFDTEDLTGDDGMDELYQNDEVNHENISITQLENTIPSSNLEVSSENPAMDTEEVVDQTAILAVSQKEPVIETEIEGSEMVESEIEEEMDAPELTEVVDASVKKVEGKVKKLKEVKKPIAPKAKVRKAAPGFSAQSLDGSTISLDDYKGDVVVLIFWWSVGPEFKELVPQLNGLVDKYKGKDVSFIAMSTEDKSTTEKFLSENPFKYDQVFDARKISHQYNIFIYPTHLVIDKKGAIMYNMDGHTTSLVNKIDGVIARGLEEGE